MKYKYPIILASSSPRRQQLMREGGYEFEVVPAEIEEPSPCAQGAYAPELWAESLAYLKAAWVAQNHREAIIIGADTIVTHSYRIVGKPADKDDARRILTNFFGGLNEVITGLAILCPARHKKIITHATTTLTMRSMSPEQIEAYLQTPTWEGKAGAYAYQEGGDQYVETIEGSESNVVGLPMEKLAEILKEHF